MRVCADDARHTTVGAQRDDAAVPLRHERKLEHALDDAAITLLPEFDRAYDPLRLVGMFNFGEEARNLTLPLPAGRWHEFELWEERYRGVVEGELEFVLVPERSCRVVALRPDRGVPCIVGTNAHIGMGALDITSLEYDVASRTLRAGIAPAGRRNRRVFVSTAGLGVLDAQFDGAPVVVGEEGDRVYVELSVDAAGELIIRFGPREK